jgi:biopolymer transport protein ExbD
LNHEFIADQAALKIIPVEKYKLELLSMVLTGQNFGLASSLNFSLTKKRLEMMKHDTTRSMKWIKIMALVPVLGALVYFVSERVIAQNDEKMPRTTTYLDLGGDKRDDVDIHLNFIESGVVSVDDKTYPLAQTSEILKQVPKKENGLVARVSINQGISTGDVFDLQMALFDNGVTHVELVKSEKKTVLSDSIPSGKKDWFYKSTTFFIQDKNGNKTKKMYSELTENEKSELPEPLTVPVKKNPSSETFEGWKDSKKFALWLDDLIIPNTKLDGMEPTQIVHVFSSRVHDNARSERFPQPYQVHLYTEAGFEKTFGPNSDFVTKPMGGTVTLKSKD